jgi:hypothetical protein
VLTYSKPRLIGSVSSDSGSIALVDPCHLGVSDSGSVCLPDLNLYTEVDTETGDGEFTVYEQRDRRGRLRRIVIELE